MADVTRWRSRPFTSGSLAFLSILTFCLYFAGGAQRGYLAADDFQWLLGGEAFSWHHLADVGSRTHFYRPVIEIWFAGAVRTCAASSDCYHVASIAVHAVNVSFVCLLGLALSKRPTVALLGATIFAVQPAYVQAVVWVSAITGLLSTTFYLVSLLCQIRSWDDDRHRRRYDLLAIAAFACAVFAHEAAVTLPLISWLIHRMFSDRRGRPAWLLCAGFALVLATFGLTAVLANQRNYVFTEGHYALGAHVFQHVLDYLVVLYIGPHRWPSYAVCVLGLVGLLAFNGMTRLGALWMLITLLPFLGFTWGNTSRYLYLPSIGFALAVAQVIVVARDRLVRRYPAKWCEGIIVAAVFLVVVRFGAFSFRAIQSQVAWLEPWRTYVGEVRSGHPDAGAGVLYVPPPSDRSVDPMYIEPMMRWQYKNANLRVVVTER